MPAEEQSVNAERTADGHKSTLGLSTRPKTLALLLPVIRPAATKPGLEVPIFGDCQGKKAAPHPRAVQVRP